MENKEVRDIFSYDNIKKVIYVVFLILGGIGSYFGINPNKEAETSSKNDEIVENKSVDLNINGNNNVINNVNNTNNVNTNNNINNNTNNISNNSNTNNKTINNINITKNDIIKKETLIVQEEPQTVITNKSNSQTHTKTLYLIVSDNFNKSVDKSIILIVDEDNPQLNLYKTQSIMPQIVDDYFIIDVHNRKFKSKIPNQLFANTKIKFIEYEN